MSFFGASDCARFNRLSVEANIRGPQDVFSGIGREGDVVQPPVRCGPVVGVDEVVGLLREVQPLGRDGAVVEHDLLGHPGAERGSSESSVLFSLGGQVVHVIKAAHAYAAAGVGLRLVLQRRLQAAGRLVPLSLEVQLEFVAVRVAEQIGIADAGIAVLPAETQARGFLMAATRRASAPRAGGAQTGAGRMPDVAAAVSFRL